MDNWIFLVVGSSLTQELVDQAVDNYRLVVNVLRRPDNVDLTTELQRKFWLNCYLEDCRIEYHFEYIAVYLVPDEVLDVVSLEEASRVLINTLSDSCVFQDVSQYVGGVSTSQGGVNDFVLGIK